MISYRSRFSGEFFMLTEKILRTVLGESRVTVLGMNLQLKDLRAGVSEGWSFISRSRMARFLPALFFFFGSPDFV